MQDLKPIVEKAKELLGKNLISVLITGTGAVPEDFIEGISDYDIALVIIDKSKKVQELVSEFELGDNFLLNIITADQLELDSGLWPFNDKFRTKCLYGKDLVARVELPSSSAAKARLKTFIQIQENKLFSRVANFRFWSEEKVKKESYSLIKHILFAYSIYYFLKRGIFLRSRQDIYKDGSEAAKQLAVLLHNWLQVKKEHIIENIHSIENVVKEIKDFCRE